MTAPSSISANPTIRILVGDRVDPEIPQLRVAAPKPFGSVEAPVFASEGGVEEPVCDADEAGQPKQLSHRAWFRPPHNEIMKAIVSAGLVLSTSWRRSRQDEGRTSQRSLLPAIFTQRHDPFNTNIRWANILWRRCLAVPTGRVRYLGGHYNNFGVKGQPQLRRAGVGEGGIAKERAHPDRAGV
jgi:hypothetical protein